MPKPPNRPALSGSFEARYPNLAAWVQHGRLEIGDDGYLRSFIRVLDEGGMIFEGAESYPSLDAALQAAEDGLAAWLKENG